MANYDKQPEKSIYATLSNHRVAGYTVEVTGQEVKKMYLETEKCRYCGRTMKHSTGAGSHCATSYSLDRVDNSKVLTKDNVQYICKECNTRKGNRSHDEYMAYARRVLELNPE